MQQDAHEFLNFLINHISEVILGKDIWKVIISYILILKWFYCEAERQQLNGSVVSETNGKVRDCSRDSHSTGSFTLNGSNGSMISNSEPTWVHEIFQGILTSETRCLNCETVRSNQKMFNHFSGPYFISSFQVSNKDEDFFDLQVDVDQNTSITNCLRTFSSTETLCTDNKFKCDVCSSYQVSVELVEVERDC